MKIELYRWIKGTATVEEIRHDIQNVDQGIRQLAATARRKDLNSDYCAYLKEENGAHIATLNITQGANSPFGGAYFINDSQGGVVCSYRYEGLYESTPSALVVSGTYGWEFSPAG